MKKLSILVALLVIVSLTFRFCTPTAQAADINAIGIATYMPVQDGVENGDIIISTPKGYFPSSKEYDPQVVGVIAENPAIALKTQSEQKGIPVVNVGSTQVKVTGTNGNIQKGDFIATSNKKGTGMKATRSGFVIGQALVDHTFKQKDDVAMIIINLNIHFFQTGSSSINNSLVQIFSISQLAAYEEPLKVFKYVISAVVLFGSFGVGFVIFSKAINTGLQALGRNPLAGRMIQLSIIFNVVLVIIIILTGIGIVWIFLRL